MELGDRFEQAVRYAAEAHATHKRKGTEIPYLQHLLGAASNALRYGASEDEAIAALLHDTAEDAGGEKRLGDIEAKFGATVAGIVRDCSDALPESENDAKPPWKERKRAYLAHLRGVEVATLVVSASDKIDNGRAIVADLRAEGATLWQRFNEKDPEQQLWYYRSLVSVFQTRSDDLEARGAGGLVEELDWVVGEIERLTRGG